jgi:hypothetical protein
MLHKSNVLNSTMYWNWLALGLFVSNSYITKFLLGSPSYCLNIRIAIYEDVCADFVIHLKFKQTGYIFFLVIYNLLLLKLLMTFSCIQYLASSVGYIASKF